VKPFGGAANAMKHSAEYDPVQWQYCIPVHQPQQSPGSETCSLCEAGALIAAIGVAFLNLELEHRFPRQLHLGAQSQRPIRLHPDDTPEVQRFAETTVPADTIVVHGEEDDVVPLAAVLAWARPQQLPLVLFPGCGHFFHGRLPQLQRTISALWRGYAERIDA